MRKSKRIDTLIFSDSCSSNSVEIRHEVPVVLHRQVLGVVQAGALVQSINLGDILVSKLNFRVGHVLSEARRVGRLDERDCLAFRVPGNNDLGGRLALRSGDLGDDWVGQQVQLLELVWCELPMA